MTPEQAMELIAKANVVLKKAADDAATKAENDKRAIADQVALRGAMAQYEGRKTIIEKILAALQAKRKDVTFKFEEPKLMTDQEAPWNRVTIGTFEIKVSERNVVPWFNVTTEYSGSGFRSRATGRRRIAVGRHGSRTSYPQKADGSFSYGKIADTLIEIIEQDKDQEQRRIAAQINSSSSEAIAKHLKAEFGLGGYSSRVQHSRTMATQVVVRIERDVTEDQARRFLTLMAQFDQEDKK